MLRATVACGVSDCTNIHEETQPYIASLDGNPMLGRGLKHATSFYVDCGFFGGGTVAAPRDRSDSLVRESDELKLAQFVELNHAEDQRIADPYYKVKVTPDLDTALIECLKTRKCTALCRNESGSTVFHQGKLKMGFGDPEKDTVVDRGPWVCLAREDAVPKEHIAGDHVEKCWQDMFDATQGVWDDRRIPRIKSKVRKVTQ
jgi:hypothetical protein